MLTNLKLCGGAALSVLLSTLLISPTHAKPVSEVTPNVSNQIAQLDNNEAIYKVYYPVGIVRTIEGDMVTIQTSNGKTVMYQVSPEEMETWQLLAGSYVLVDQENNKILDTVYEGEIKSIVGTVVTVELENGKLEKYGVDRGTLGAMNLMEGKDVYVTKSNIVALAPEPDIDEQAYLINTVRPASAYQETQVQQTQTPMTPMIESNQSIDNTQSNDTRMNQMEPMNQQQNNYDTQTNYQQNQNDEPVRGMW